MRNDIDMELGHYYCINSASGAVVRTALDPGQPATLRKDTATRDDYSLRISMSVLVFSPAHMQLVLFTSKP
jgi:hypothetical protein